MKTALIILFAVLLASWAKLASAENLHQKYGPSWDCGYITAGLPIYDYCKPCEDKGMEFFKDSDISGHCVPKEGSAEQEVEQPPVVVPKKAPPKKKVRVQYTIRFCNKAGPETMYVALGTNDQLGGVMRFTLRGWYSIPTGVCKDLAVKEFGNYNEMVFAYHAQVGQRFWPAKVWPADSNWSPEEWLKNRAAEQVNFCVDPSKAFERYTEPLGNCSANHQRGFGILWVEKQDGAKMIVKEVHVK